MGPAASAAGPFSVSHAYGLNIRNLPMCLRSLRSGFRLASGAPPCEFAGCSLPGKHAAATGAASTVLSSRGGWGRRRSGGRQPLEVQRESGSAVVNHTSFDLTRSVENDAARVDRLMEDVARSMQGGGGPLTDHQRALMWGVITDLVRTVLGRIAGAIRDAALRGSTEDHAAFASVAESVAEAVAAQQIDRLADIAARAGMLRDKRLIRLVFARVQSHLLSEIMRPPGRDRLAPDLEQLLSGEDLDRYRDQELRRLDAYGDPRLPLDDLPHEVLDALHWQMAAALRKLLLERPAADTVAVDDALEAAVAAVLRQPPPLPEAERLDRRATIPPTALLQALANGDVFLFLMLLGQVSGLTLGRLQAIAFGRAELEFATLCRALDLPRNHFADLYLLVCQQSSGTVRDPGALAEAMHTYDAIDPGDARAMLRLWRRHPGYTGAIRRMTDG